jgi:tetratricopeptide (TPR) repeat protein
MEFEKPKSTYKEEEAPDLVCDEIEEESIVNSKPQIDPVGQSQHGSSAASQHIASHSPPPHTSSVDSPHTSSFDSPRAFSTNPNSSSNDSPRKASPDSPRESSTQQGFSLGTIIDGKYTLESFIGEGGMGTVYKCAAEGFQQPLAIKLLRPEFVNDAISKKRFESEAQVASELAHENTVSLYAFGVEPGGTPYIVMDYADGENLSEILKKERTLSRERFFNIFSQVCEALEYAHERGVVHRDIKPSNIIVTKNGADEIVKLVDFGIAKLLPRGADVSSFNLTLTGDVFGTPKYMSPEQCQGHNLNQTTDIYSLGCLMYEALAGHPVFEGDNAVQIIVKHITEKPKRIFKQGKEVEPELQNTIQRCLEKDPNKRFKSAKELLNALKRNATGQGRFQFSTKQKLLGTATALGLVLVLASIGFMVSTHQQPPRIVAGDDSTWKMYHDAGMTARDQQHYVEAIAMWTSALQEAEKVFPANDIRLAETLHDLGEMKHIHNEEAIEAEKLFQRCLDIRQKVLKPDDRDMADIYGHLGAVKGDLEKHSESLELFDKAIAIAEKSDKELSIHYQELKIDELLAQKKYGEAEALGKKVLALRTSEPNSENSEDTASAIEKLGYVYAVQDMYDQCIPLYRRAQKIREEGGFTDNPFYPWLIQSIATAYADIGDLTHARDYYLKAVKAWETRDDVESLASSYQELAETVAKQGENRLASEYFKRAVELRQSREEKNPKALASAIAQSVYSSMLIADLKSADVGLKRLKALSEKRGRDVLNTSDDHLDDIIEEAEKASNNDILQAAKQLRSQ